jgi:hypothetical protein
VGGAGGMGGEEHRYFVGPPLIMRGWYNPLSARSARVYARRGGA